MGNPFLAMIVPMGDGAGAFGGGQPPYPSSGSCQPFATQLPIIIPGAPPGSPGFAFRIPSICRSIPTMDCPAFPITSDCAGRTQPA